MGLEGTGLLMKVCGIAADIDGTLTLSREGFLLDLEVAAKLRSLELNGVRVMLVTGNAAPVVAGLARYMGFRGPHVAENGCMLYSEELGVEPVCRSSCIEAARLVERKLSHMLKPSWQNRYRSFDFAFRVRKGDSPKEAVNSVRRLLESAGIDCRVSFSGYAIHIRPPEASKGRGLREAIKAAGLEPGCIIAVGDSAMDVEMGEAGVILAAVGNADEELRRRAKIVLKGSSSQGVRELIDLLESSQPIR